MEVALSCGDLGLPIDILRIILLEGMRGKNYMKCVMARVCELWKRVISHQSFFNESMGIILSNGSLALPHKILERILFETMKCGDHMFLKLGSDDKNKFISRKNTLRMAKPYQRQLGCSPRL